MQAIELRFPASRFHATAWDHHVNEGLIEWPPSPWRLLRALIGTWHAKARHDVAEAAVMALVECLAGSLPLYDLPRGSVISHTRHYMPVYKGKPKKIFDAFLHVPRGAALIVSWPNAELDHESREALSILCNRVGYLGRAESWTSMRVKTGGGHTANVLPLGEGEVIAADQQVVRVLAPMSPAELEAWRRTALDERLARRLADKQAKTAARGTSRPQRLTAKERAGVEAELPNNLWEALQCDTGELRKAGWSQPPGSRWVAYTRPRDSLETAPPPRRRRVAKVRPPTVARFALASQVPPRLTEAVRLAERVREALIKHSEGAPVFVGRDGESPMVGHRHAHVLPECNGAFGHISHVTVYAPMGFDAAARWALDRVRALRRRDSNHDQLVLLGVGQPEEYGGVDLASGQCPLLAKSAVWESRTPFIATRHVKRRGRAARPDENGLVAGSPEHDLRRLLAELQLPAPDAVEALEGTTLGGKLARWLSFRAERVRGGGRRGGGGPVGFRVRFSKPVRGPIAVGYGAHFGLGQMVPARVFGVGPGDW